MSIESLTFCLLENGFTAGTKGRATKSARQKVEAEGKGLDKAVCLCVMAKKTPVCVCVCVSQVYREVH